MTPAEYLRTLDQQATPGPIIREGSNVFTKDENVAAYHGPHGVLLSHYYHDVNDAILFVALRTLLPALADVVEAAEKSQEWIAVEYAGPGSTAAIRKCQADLNLSLLRLAAAVAEVKGE